MYLLYLPSNNPKNRIQSVITEFSLPVVCESSVNKTEFLKGTDLFKSHVTVKKNNNKE